MNFSISEELFPLNFICFFFFTLLLVISKTCFPCISLDIIWAGAVKFCLYFLLTLSSGHAMS